VPLSSAGGVDSRNGMNASRGAARYAWMRVSALTRRCRCAFSDVRFSVRRRRRVRAVCQLSEVGIMPSGRCGGTDLYSQVRVGFESRAGIAVRPYFLRRGAMRDRSKLISRA